MTGPLTDIRVLDLSRVVAGPWCTQILADLGAQVIKVERPETGDDTRHWGPPWFADKTGRATSQSAYYLAANRGKHSVTINFADERGRELLRALAGECDVLIENFKTGDLASKGLGYDDLCADNPGLIYCSITGFGQTGPMADVPGYDYLIQAQGGLMSVTGLPDGEPGSGPLRVGVAVADLTTGMNAAIAILAALHHRNQSGQGQYIDMALLDVQVSWLANQAQNYFCSGESPGRTGEHHPNLAPYQPFPTLDGDLIIAVGNDAQFQRLCAVMELPELAVDNRFATNPARVENRDDLTEIFKQVTRGKTSREWMDLLDDAKVPNGPVQTIDQVFADPQVVARKMIVDVEHPELGPVRTVANPIKFSATPVEYRKAPPLLGEDTDSVLSGLLGLSDEQIEALRRAAVI